MRIVQISTFIGPGSGVAGVAWALEREFRAAGHEVESFTYERARSLRRRRPPRHRITERIAQVWRLWWFSTVGTGRARRFLADRPDAVSVCHGNVMAGDVFVDHGIMSATMRANGDPLWRRWGNPNQWFVSVRDHLRYRSAAHRVVVVPTADEGRTLRRVYGRVRPSVEVIPHGVDLERFRPPTPQARSVARAALLLDPEDRVALFIGHEFERKGLTIAIDALVMASTVLLLVIGGTAPMVESARRRAEDAGVADRVLFVGPQQDLEPFLSAGDVLAFPSARESSGLVVLEALASGLPVVSTRVGVAVDVILDGVNGYLVDRDPQSFAEALELIAATEPGVWGVRARASVEGLSWHHTAERYIDLFERVRRERSAA